MKVPAAEGPGGVDGVPQPFGFSGLLGKGRRRHRSLLGRVLGFLWVFKVVDVVSLGSRPGSPTLPALF